MQLTDGKFIKISEFPNFSAKETNGVFWSIETV